MGSLLNSEIPEDVWEEMDDFFTNHWDPNTRDVYLLPSLVRHFGLPNELKDVLIGQTTRGKDSGESSN